MLSRLSPRQSFVLLLLLVFAVEAGLGMFVMRDLLTTYAQVEHIYVLSVQGLLRIGELQYEAQETRRTTLYALTTNEGDLQVEYADQSRGADRLVSEGIAQYLQQAREPQEIVVGERLTRDWNAYLKVRDDVLGLILENSVKEAVSEDLTSGVSLFDRVRQDLDEIKRLYDEQASQQLALVNRSSRRSELRLVGGFAFALLFGSAAILAIERNKARNAMHLAKLQMDFVASVSHELRTPIAAILCAGENFRDGFAQQRKEDLAEQGSIIVDQATHLASLVDQVLLFAATTAKPEYILRPLQVSEIIASALRNTAGVLHKSEFTVEQQVEPGLPEVTGDLGAISQCLQNLILNAIKYGTRERRITVSARIADSEDGDREVEISVQDNGPGISKSDLPRIFEPFYRNPQLAASHSGTGLGLSIAKTMMEAMGGRLSVASEAGVGSIFTLHLLVARKDSQTDSVGAAPGSQELVT